MGNAAKQVTPKDRFVGCLAYKPWCGDDKSAQLVRPINLALQKAYIAPNPPAMVHWLIFDLDHDNCFIWSDKGLPEPNIIVQNPENGHCHLYYAISPVCVSENARISPIRYMEAVARGMTLALEADESYTGRIAKNPLWPFWKTSEIHSYEYSLDELASEVTPVAKTYTYDESDVPDSRNCALFHRLRHWAYMQVNAYRESSNEDEWHKATLEKALGLSALEPDFTYNEVRNRKSVV